MTVDTIIDIIHEPERGEDEGYKVIVTLTVNGKPYLAEGPWETLDEARKRGTRFNNRIEQKVQEAKGNSFRKKYEPGSQPWVRIL